MKNLAALVLGSLLVLNFAFADNTATAADKKWLAAVEKMVTSGDRRVSTPNESRVKLLKEWAAKKGYTVEVAKTEAGFKVELSKTVAQQ